MTTKNLHKFIKDSISYSKREIRWGVFYKKNPYFNIKRDYECMDIKVTLTDYFFMTEYESRIFI